QALRDGIWNDLTAPALAGAIAAVMYEPRSDEPSPIPRFTGTMAPMGEALRETSACAREIIALEADFDLEVTTPLDMGLVLPIFHWASGLGLDIVLADTDLAAGDFVRWARQVLDLLDQVALVAPTPRLRRTARERSEEHTSELQSRFDLVCRLLLEK